MPSSERKRSSKQQDAPPDNPAPAPVPSKPKRRRQSQNSDEDVSESEPARKAKVSAWSRRKRARNTSDSEKESEGEGSGDEEAPDHPKRTRSGPNASSPMQISGDEAVTAIIGIRLALSLSDNIEVFEGPRPDCHVAFRRRSPSARWMPVCVPSIVANDIYTMRKTSAHAVYVMRFAHDGATKGGFARLVPGAAGGKINCFNRDVAVGMQAEHPRITPGTSVMIATALIAMYDRVCDSGSDEFELVELRQSALVRVPRPVLPRAQKRAGKSTAYVVKKLGPGAEFYKAVISAFRERSDISLDERLHPDFHFLIGPANGNRYIAVSLPRDRQTWELRLFR
jgi:hypothetical protein